MATLLAGCGVLQRALSQAPQRSYPAIITIMNTDILIPDEKGLYCPAGGFHIDPWRPVRRAVITHAHGDHARPGSTSYLCASPGERPLSLRMGKAVQTLAYGEQLTIGNAVVSLHPAGHVLGSAQIRVEVNGEIWVVSGDYKREPDSTCAPFEVVRCHTFITEATFGLPIYRWHPADQVLADIRKWWQHNAQEKKTSILFCYVMGKTQRIMASLQNAAADIGPLFAHGAMQQMNEAYRQSSVALPAAPNPVDMPPKHDFTGALVFAPPSAQGTSWMRRFKNTVTGRASGWMRVRGRRRRLAIDRGFVLSDHADWSQLLRTIGDTGAERVIATHGSTASLVRYLREEGVAAEAVASAPWDEVEDI